MSACTSSSSAGRRSPSCSSGMDSFFRSIRRTLMTAALATSFGPTSSRTGTPRSSCSLYFQPGEYCSRSSTCSRTRSPSAAFTWSMKASTSARSSGLRQIGTTTACTGATRGGSCSPLSSPWVMMTPPIRRVETPHEVCQTYWRSALLVLVGDVEDLGEVLAEVVRGAGLQGVAVLHQRLDRVGHVGAGELLGVALRPGVHRHGQLGLGEVAVDLEHAQHLRLAVLGGGVGGVALLPEELGGAQEGPRHHLPAHDVRPLVDEHRQVAVRLDPLRVHRADDRLAGRPDGEALLELLVPAVRHPGDLRARSPRRARPPSAAGSPGSAAGSRRSRGRWP